MGYTELVKSKENTLDYLTDQLQEENFPEIGDFLFFVFVGLEHGDPVREAVSEWWDNLPDDTRELIEGG